MENIKKHYYVKINLKLMCCFCRRQMFINGNCLLINLVYAYAMHIPNKEGVIYAWDFNTTDIFILSSVFFMEAYTTAHKTLGLTITC